MIRGFYSSGTQGSHFWKKKCEKFGLTGLMDLCVGDLLSCLTTQRGAERGFD